MAQQLIFVCVQFVQMRPAFLPLRRRRGTFSGSRYFTHDLLLPTDECEDEFLERAGRTSGGSGRPSQRHRSRAATTTEAPNVTQQRSALLRASSLQAGRTMVHGDTYIKRSFHSSTIVRQCSSPSIQNSQTPADINCRYCQVLHEVNIPRLIRIWAVCQPVPSQPL
jgi:hypothetical protein